MTNVFKVKIIGTTNEKVKKRVGEIYSCQLINNFMLLTREDGRYIRTSKVEEYEQDDRRITLKTLNSIYELEIV